ncbi:hypothetical protein [Nostoc parmelioides]|uniref:Uncharacterized protein n=1 Tax=Nostoc parmelioides FACHB-3921 TaxID=2692909 RepID=A0ABR8BPF1_9NOSO|nr:hypothetical protein [Nostoc parmelioides]MBD2255142.1 hypothetical protein [Nostoc parmelioides FACHB-3921]
MSNRGTGATREGEGYTAGKWICMNKKLPQQYDGRLKLICRLSSDQAYMLL